jgi:uncharacterized protein (TIGR03437 family)
MATGLSSGLNNGNASNDVWLANGRRLENYAEQVTVEAKTTNGQIFRVPVEYAGWQGTVRGLDQVSIIVVPELTHQANVQLTIIAAGVRSNTLMVSFN